MIGSFEVGVIMGTIVGVGLSYCAYIIHDWWQSTHPKDVDWDPSIREDPPAVNWFHRPPLSKHWLWLVGACISAATFVDGGGIL